MNIEIDINFGSLNLIQIISENRKGIKITSGTTCLNRPTAWWPTDHAGLVGPASDWPTGTTGSS
jgi:hypothetical protein